MVLTTIISLSNYYAGEQVKFWVRVGFIWCVGGFFVGIDFFFLVSEWGCQGITLNYVCEDFQMCNLSDSWFFTVLGHRVCRTALPCFAIVVFQKLEYFEA